MSGRIVIGLIMIEVVMVASGCRHDPPIVVAPAERNSYKENLINANRTMAQSEETAIAQYVERKGWPMQRLSNGIRIWIYEAGEGKAVDYEERVTVRYDVEAINGKEIYKGEEETYTTGRRQEMIGLDEAVLTLRHGSKAKVILPSNLGYGMAGDGDRIPRNCILVLDLSVE